MHVLTKTPSRTTYSCLLFHPKPLTWLNQNLNPRRDHRKRTRYHVPPSRLKKTEKTRFAARSYVALSRAKYFSVTWKKSIHSAASSNQKRHMWLIRALPANWRAKSRISCRRAAYSLTARCPLSELPRRTCMSKDRHCLRVILILSWTMIWPEIGYSLRWRHSSRLG